MPGLAIYPFLICHQVVISTHSLTFVPGLVTYFLICRHILLPGVNFSLAPHLRTSPGDIFLLMCILTCSQRVILANCLTFMPGLVTYFLIGDQTVIPAHSKGAASAGLMLSGILTARFPEPLNLSAKPPLFSPPPMMVAAPSGQMFCSQTASIHSYIHHA